MPNKFDNYLVPTVQHPLNATVSVPGSKSLTNRYLVLNYLSNVPVKLHNQLVSRDTELMEQALEQLRNSSAGSEVVIDTGLAGTVMRFVPPLAALRTGLTHFDGDSQARMRPMGPILDGLEAIGTEVVRKNGDYLPFSICGSGKVNGGRLEIDASTSSQFVSGLLLSAAAFENPTEIVHIGNQLPSLAHIDMTINVLNKCGVVVQTEESDGKIAWTVQPSAIQVPETVIEPDLSNAGPFLAAALANPNGGVVRILNWPKVTTQPGNEFLKILPSMGATIERIEGQLVDTVQISSSGTIRGIDIDLSRAGEITPTVAALCALANSPSTLRGIGHLRGHETDRLVALVTEIRKLGREAEIIEGGTAIQIGQYPEDGLKSAVIESYNDHRMATFGAIVGLKIPRTEVTNIETTAKTMPDFVQMWENMLQGDA
jgi:3-phosphoshikimate 1-carboxyvinyltransferase